jgi:hypothetical protein
VWDEPGRRAIVQQASHRGGPHVMDARFSRREIPPFNCRT